MTSSSSSYFFLLLLLLLWLGNIRKAKKISLIIATAFRFSCSLGPRPSSATFHDLCKVKTRQSFSMLSKKKCFKFQVLLSEGTSVLNWIKMMEKRKMWMRVGGAYHFISDNRHSVEKSPLNILGDLHLKANLQKHLLYHFTRWYFVAVYEANFSFSQLKIELSTQHNHGHYILLPPKWSVWDFYDYCSNLESVEEFH